MDDNEQLPFRLVGMSREEFYEELYADIPSDNESENDSDDKDSDSEVPDEHIETPEIELESDNDWDDEDLRPLSTFIDVPVDRQKPKWNKIYNVCKPTPFLEDSGPVNIISNGDIPSPCQLFELFLSDNIIDNIVFQTNLYATQTRQGRMFVHLTKIEFKCFVAINLLMGLKKLPSYRDFWSSAPDLHDSFVSKLMTVNRFGWILTNLHINDNELMPKRNSPDFDKLYKIRPFLSSLQINFLKYFRPSEYIAIDESMIKFKGRSSLKQYLPKKPIKRGYKVWVLADKSGYCYKFDIYTGKTGDSPEKGLGVKVVNRLCQGLENKGHKIFFDNYFSSVELMEILKKFKIFACATINPTRRELPDFRRDKELKQGDFDYFISNSGIYTVKWKDKRCVHLISNYHQANEVTKVNRKTKTGVIQEISCPTILSDYNANMNSVDKLDQLKSCYELDRKSKKWWHRIFFHFLDVCVVNSYVIHKQLNTGTKISLKNFKREIINSLISETQVNNNKRSKSHLEPLQIKKHKPYVPPEIRNKENLHMPMYGSRRRCAHCSTREKQIRTDWMCQTCTVPLCLSKSKNCFYEYHAV